MSIGPRAEASSCRSKWPTLETGARVYTSRTCVHDLWVPAIPLDAVSELLSERVADTAQAAAAAWPLSIEPRRLEGDSLEPMCVAYVLVLYVRNCCSWVSHAQVMSCARILHLMLGSRPGRLDARVTSCQEMLGRRFHEGLRFLQHIVTDEESWVHYYEPETKRQSNMWKY